MNFIPNIAKAPKMFSVQASALVVVLAQAWLAVPPEVQALVPPKWLALGASALAALSILGRLIDQGLSKP